MVWTLTLQPESEGPSLISYAARLLSGGHSGLLSAPSWRTIIGMLVQASDYEVIHEVVGRDVEVLPIFYPRQLQQVAFVGEPRVPLDRRRMSPTSSPSSICCCR